LTNTAISSARLYWENKFTYFDAKNVSIPVAVSVFPDELYPAPRSWAERAYPNLIHYNKPDKGGHFATGEQPQLFSEEIRAGFRPLRWLERGGGAHDLRRHPLEHAAATEDSEKYAEVKVGAIA
jgi:hypothetical protein